MWRAGGRRSNAYSICRGIASAGTGSASVLRHRSHITHRHGHWRLVRKTVAAGTGRRSGPHSSSTRNAYGRHGSTALRGPRRDITHASRPRAESGYADGVALIALTRTSPGTGCETPTRFPAAGQAPPAASPRAGNGAWGKPAFASP